MTIERFRVTCRAPAPEPVADGTARLLYPKINGIVPSLTDCTVTALCDDGTEIPVGGVRRIYFSVADDGAPVDLAFELLGGELDVELEAAGVTVESFVEHVERASETTERAEGGT